LRRGQAGPVSVMILAAATLVVALALYAYFTGVYAGQQRALGLVDLVAAYSSGVGVFEEASLSYADPGGGGYAYCYIVSVVNRMGGPAYFYVALLPGAPGPGGAVSVNPQFLLVPVLYSGTAPAERTVHVWLAVDEDRDGVVELVGSDANGARVIAWETVPPCRDLYENRNNLNVIRPLVLPTEADDPYFGFNGSRVYLRVDGLPLSESLRVAVPGAPASVYVPMWNVSLGAGEKASLLVFAWAPEPLESASLVVFVGFEGRYYAALAAPLSVPEAP